MCAHNLSFRLLLQRYTVQFTFANIELNFVVVVLINAKPLQLAAASWCSLDFCLCFLENAICHQVPHLKFQLNRELRKISTFCGWWLLSLLLLLGDSGAAIANCDSDGSVPMVNESRMLCMSSTSHQFFIFSLLPRFQNLFI